MRRIAWSFFLLCIFCNLIYQMRALTQSTENEVLVEKILILMTIDHKYKTSVHWASQYVYLDELITKHFYIGWLWCTRLCCNGFLSWCCCCCFWFFGRKKGCNFFFLFSFCLFISHKVKANVPFSHQTLIQHVL